MATTVLFFTEIQILQQGTTVCSHISLSQPGFHGTLGFLQRLLEIPCAMSNFILSDKVTADTNFIYL